MGAGVFADHHDRVATEVQRDHHYVLIAIGTARLRTVKEVPVRAFSLEENRPHQFRVDRFLVRASMAYESAIREMPWSPRSRGLNEHEVFSCEECCISAHTHG